MNTANESLVDYRLVRWHLFAAGTALLVSMVAGFEYSLQFLGFFPHAGSEYASPGHFRLIHTNMAAYGWLVRGALLEELGRHGEAVTALERAASLARSDEERRQIDERLAASRDAASRRERS